MIPRRSRRGRFEAEASDTCGCAMGARFIQVVMIAAIGWYALHWRSSGLSVSSMAVRVLGWSFLGGVAGKIIGILSAKFRARTKSLHWQPFGIESWRTHKNLMRH
jgi:hypothetical protein